MDVNMPKVVTGIHASNGYADEDRAGRSRAMNELAVYLWENYIEYAYYSARPKLPRLNLILAVTMLRKSILLGLAPHTQVLSVSCKAAVCRILYPLSIILGLILLNHLENDFIQRVFGLVNFISEGPLVPVSEQGAIWTQSKYQTLSKWYRSVSNTRLLHPMPGIQHADHIDSQLSLNIISDTHLVWNIDAGKKPSKRFGNLVRSHKTSLNDILVQHQTQVQSFISERSEARGRRPG